MKKVVNHLTGFYCLFYTFIMCSGKGSFVKNVFFIGFLAVLVAVYFKFSDTAEFDIQKHKSLYIPVFIMLSYAMLTIVWSRSSNESLNGLMPWLSGWAVAFLQINVIEDEHDLNVLINDLHIYFLILMWIGNKECETGEYNYIHSPIYELRPNGLDNYYPAAGFSNTNNYAYILSILFPFAIYDHFVGRLSKSKLKFLLFIYELITYCWLIINTTSRLAMLSIVLFIIFILFYNARNLQKSKASLLIFVGFLAVLLILMSLFSQGEGHLTDFISYQFEGTLSEDSESDRVRYSLFKAGMKMFFTHPIGVGIGESEYFSDEYYDDINRANMPLHNMMLIIACEFGVIGIICFVFIIYQALKKLWNARLISTTCNVQSGILIASIVCFIFMSMVPSNATKYPLAYMLFGVWYAYDNVFKDRNPELELFNKKENANLKYGYVKPYDREQALKDHNENLRRLRERNNSR